MTHLAVVHLVVEEADFLQEVGGDFQELWELWEVLLVVEEVDFLQEVGVVHHVVVATFLFLVVWLLGRSLTMAVLEMIELVAFQ